MTNGAPESEPQAAPAAQAIGLCKTYGTGQAEVHALAGVDVTFKEDASRIRKNPGIFARLRTIAYNVLRCNQSETMPQDRFAAALGGLDAVLAMVFSRER